ncbi:MAG: ABC transporter ATP-binding protein [Planctomycetota bacterium]
MSGDGADHHDDSVVKKLRKALQFAIPHRGWMFLWGACVLLYTVANAGVVLVLAHIDKPFDAPTSGPELMQLEQPVKGVKVKALDPQGRVQSTTADLPTDWWVTQHKPKGGLLAAVTKGKSAKGWDEEKNPPAAIDSHLLAWFLAAVVGCLLLKFLTDFGREYSGRIIGTHIAVDLQNICIRKLLSLPISHFVGKQQGQTYITMTTDIGMVGSVSTLALRVVREPVAILGLVGSAFLVNWRLALIGLLGIPLILLQVRWLGKVIRRQTRSIRGESAKLLDSVDRVAKGIRMIKVYHAEEAEAGNTNAIAHKIFKSAKRMIRAQAISRPLTDFLGMIFIVAAIGAAGWLYLSGLIQNVNGAEVLALVVALTQIQPALKRLSQAWEEVSTAMPSIERMEAILQIQPAIVDAPDAVTLENYRGPIEFHDVAFGYDHEVVLKKVNLRFEEGETIGIVGPTGAGKSTLTSLLARFYDPTAGEIRIDGLSLTKIKLDSWMKQLALVDQNSFVFNSTVYENIRYGRPDATREEVIAAAKAAHIYEEFAGTELGLDTNCGDLGGNISGGQRQRLALARAILKNAPILILDEATSSLDPAVEARVQADIDVMLQNRRRTTFIVAHRLTTLRNVDRIIVLDGSGDIEAFAPREELLKPGVSPTFQRLWEHTRTK